MGCRTLAGRTEPLSAALEKILLFAGRITTALKYVMSDKQDYVLAIDNGTQSVRALVFDLRGQIVAKSKMYHRLSPLYHSIRRITGYPR